MHQYIRHALMQNAALFELEEQIEGKFQYPAFDKTSNPSLRHQFCKSYNLMPRLAEHSMPQYIHIIRRGRTRRMQMQSSEAYIKSNHRWDLSPPKFKTNEKYNR